MKYKFFYCPIQNFTYVKYFQLCDLMSDGEWTLERDDDLTAPYAFKSENWIAFEDKTSIGIKANI